MYACIYIYIYIHTYLYTYVCLCVYIHMCVYIYTYIDVCCIYKSPGTARKVEPVESEMVGASIIFGKELETKQTAVTKPKQTNIFLLCSTVKPEVSNWLPSSQGFEGGESLVDWGLEHGLRMMCCIEPGVSGVLVLPD